MKKLIMIVFFISISFVLWGQSQGQFAIDVAPGVEYPFEIDFKYFDIGGGVGISGIYDLPINPLFHVRGDLSYSYMPIWTGDGCNVISLGGGAGVNILRSSKLAASIFGTGGYYQGLIADESNETGGNIFWCEIFLKIF